MAQIIAVAVVKGGTAKTTTCAVLAQAAVHEGKRVLCIDLDAQCNLTRTIGGDPTGAGAVELLHHTKPASDLIQKTEQGIDIIPAHVDLALEVGDEGGSFYRLEQAIKPIKRQYDVILIDTPPRLSEVTYNALQAATGLLIPLETDVNSLQGMYQIIDVADLFKKSNPKLKILGCVITRYDKRSKFNRYMQEQITIKGKENKCPLLCEIRQGVVIKEAQALQVSLFDYAPNSNPAIDYMALYNLIIKTK